MLTTPNLRELPPGPPSQGYDDDEYQKQAEYINAINESLIIQYKFESDVYLRCYNRYTSWISEAEQARQLIESCFPDEILYRVKTNIHLDNILYGDKSERNNIVVSTATTATTAAISNNITTITPENPLQQEEAKAMLISISQLLNGLRKYYCFGVDVDKAYSKLILNHTVKLSNIMLSSSYSSNSNNITNTDIPDLISFYIDELCKWAVDAMKIFPYEYDDAADNIILLMLSGNILHNRTAFATQQDHWFTEFFIDLQYRAFRDLFTTVDQFVERVRECERNMKVEEMKRALDILEGIKKREELRMRRKKITFCVVHRKCFHSTRQCRVLKWVREKKRNACAGTGTGEKDADGEVGLLKTVKDGKVEKIRNGVAKVEFVRDEVRVMMERTLDCSGL
ncbi:hypothetical protein HDU76_000827 [Blyttiomyces sp. JEL0837]|nr:hypothetical protein HDU76_000827 [Blyttiomyces sp. JEL0837]